MLRTLIFCFVLSPLFLSAQEPNSGSNISDSKANYIDDRSVYRRLKQTLEEYLVSENAVDGDNINSQLDDAPERLTIDAERMQLPDDESPSLARARAATVIIANAYNCGKCNRKHLSIGGGVIISPDGLVLTNHHVMTGLDTYAFMASTADGKTYPVVEVLAANELHDVALVRIKGSNLPYCSISKTNPAPGQRNLIFSHPQNRFFTTTRGIVSRYSKRFDRRKSLEPQKWMEVSTRFGKGSSGCGVFNLGGELIGLCSRKEELKTEGKNEEEVVDFVIYKCVPLDAIQQLLFGGSKASAKSND